MDSTSTKSAIQSTKKGQETRTSNHNRFPPNPSRATVKHRKHRQDSECKESTMASRYIPENLLWFDDGTIVLESQDHIFKVYASFLKKHSAFFRGLARGTETYDGVRIVHLPSRWYCEDVKNVLMVLFLYPNQSYQPIHTPKALEFLSSLLLMSHRLEIPTLEADALHQLHLRGFHTRFESLMGEFPTTTNFNFTDTRPSTTDILHVVNAAKRSDNEVLLPMAYYYLSALSIENLMALSDIPVSDILDSETGGEPKSSNAGSRSQPQERSLITSWKPVLSTKDLQTCLIGRETLIKSHHEKIWTAATSAVLHKHKHKHNGHCLCTSSFQTLSASPTLRALLHLPSVFANTLDDAFEATQNDPDMRLCGKCYDSFWSALNVARKAVWDELPGVFGLREWSVLRRDVGGIGEV